MMLNRARRIGARGRQWAIDEFVVQADRYGDLAVGMIRPRIVALEYFLAAA